MKYSNCNKCGDTVEQNYLADAICFACIDNSDDIYANSYDIYSNCIQEQALNDQLEINRMPNIKGSICGK